jgi:hypothetical protein
VASAGDEVKMCAGSAAPDYRVLAMTGAAGRPPQGRHRP